MQRNTRYTATLQEVKDSVVFCRNTYCNIDQFQQVHDFVLVERIDIAGENGDRLDVWQSELMNKMVLAFMGTQNALQMVDNTLLNTIIGLEISVPNSMGLIKTALQSCDRLTRFAGELVLTGHSRGGILACRAMEVLLTNRFRSMVLITYGCPAFSIGHSITPYVTLVELSGDPIPPLSIALLPLNPIGWFTGKPQYTSMIVKYDSNTPSTRDLDGWAHHNVDVYRDIICSTALPLTGLEHLVRGLMPRGRTIRLGGPGGEFKSQIELCLNEDIEVQHHMAANAIERISISQKYSAARSHDGFNNDHSRKIIQGGIVGVKVQLGEYWGYKCIASMKLYASTGHFTVVGKPWNRNDTDVYSTPASMVVKRIRLCAGGALDAIELDCVPVGDIVGVY